MPEPEATAHNSHRGHPLPRRTSPANSVTLKHHRLARDASLRASAGSGPANHTNSNSNSSPRRNSSGESQDTGRSDPMKWFDQSNQNPTATFDNNIMEVDPPFYQKESDSSNEDSRPFHFPQQTSAPRLMQAQSSSADDYRSVIDDLTVEIQKLKEELKRYKQKGPDLMRKEKLFEIKIHGLPKRKKRELETTLRDFAAGLEGSPDASSSQQRKSRHANRDNMYGGSGSMSKHASSSSGSNQRPVDSAYASMSTGANSSGASLGRPSMNSRSSSSEQKVESYLRDIPEGLYPRQTAMSDRERKKLTVRRLEQLFTGKITGRGIRRILPPPPPPTDNAAAASLNSNNEDNDVDVLAPVTTDAQSQLRSAVHQPPGLLAAPGASREARILPTEQQQHSSGKKSRSRDNGSASNEDQVEGNSSGGTNPSPTPATLPEQRPTRPKDLDPDRVQVPSDNMDYIRHLGLVPPELLGGATPSMQDVHPDAEGWVYLNLLCNLAQLHIINVTPSFVRSAVSEMSTKFQLSPDGRKIRWRGGSDGTRFTSESSASNSQDNMDTEDSDDTNKQQQRKRVKTKSTGEGGQSGGSSGKHQSKFGPQFSTSSESFHYKPLFVQQDSVGGNTSPEDTLSSFGRIEDSQVGESGWGQSGSGTSNRRKRRHDGAIIYYSGAPFCTDLSGDTGDTGDVSPTTYMMSSGQAQQENIFERPLPFRTASGSSLSYRPLSEKPKTAGGEVEDDAAGDPGLTTDSGEDGSEIDFEMPWTDDQQYIEVRPLEPCGLGGVLPDDHFMVVVTTARAMTDSTEVMQSQHWREKTEEATDGIIGRLATMSTASPKPCDASGIPTRVARTKGDIEIQYMSGRIKRLAPVPLPPPAIFFPPFSTDTSSSEEGMSVDMDEEDTSDEQSLSRQAEPHQSDGYPDDVDLTSGDEDGEDPDDEPDAQKMYDIGAVDGDDEDETKTGSAGTAPRGRSKSANPAGSSAATVGGIPSGCSSSENDQ